MKSIHEGEEFWVTRSKREADEFLARILASLLDYLSEMEGQIVRVERMDPQQLDETQRLFSFSHEKVKICLKQFEDAKLSFEFRYNLAVLIQESIMEMELNSDW